MEGRWACCSHVGGLAGQVPTLHMYLLEQSLPKHSKNWKLPEICGFDLQLGPLKENTG